MQYYPDNTARRFNTKLERPISLSGDWEVGLLEIEYKRSWYTINDTENSIRYCFAVDGDIYIEWLSIPPGYYGNIKDLVAKINAAIGRVSGKRPREKWSLLKYDDISRKIVIFLQKGDNFNFSDDLQLILGITGPILGYNDDTWFTGEEVCDIDRKVSSIFIYCDATEHVPIGDVTAPLLRTIAVGGKQGEIIRRIFDKPLYVPIRKKNFDSIEIDMRTDTGDPIPFESGKSSVTLHFRLSKNRYLI